MLFALAMLYTFDVVYDIAMNLQGSWLSARRHAPVMNRLHGLWSLGTVIGGVIAARAAAAGVSLATHLLVVSGVLLVTLLFVGRGLLPVDEHVATDDVVDDADRPDPGDQIDPRGHHRCRVDQRGHRGRACHRVWEPDV